MGWYQISPDQPPFPSPMNLPFQPDTGIQTSNLMLESFVGLISPATRQNAGKLPKSFPGKCNSSPAGSSLASVIVVSASVSVARLSQVVALADLTQREDTAEKSTADAIQLRKRMKLVLPDSQGFIAASPKAERIRHFHVELLGVNSPPLSHCRARRARPAASRRSAKWLRRAQAQRAWLPQCCSRLSSAGQSCPEKRRARSQACPVSIDDVCGENRW